MFHVKEKDYKDIVKNVGADKMAEYEKNGKKPVGANEKIVKIPAKSKENSLEKNTARIVELHNLIVDFLVQSLAYAITIGGLLFDQKALIRREKGSFTQWVNDNLSFSLRTAQRYMQIYQHREPLIKNNIKTITEAYAHICGEPVSDEVVDADDSTELPQAVTRKQIDLDEPDLPQKKAKGLMKEFVLNKANVEGFISGPFYNDCQGKYIKIIVELKYRNIENMRIAEFVSAAEKYLKPGGKLIFHKR